MHRSGDHAIGVTEVDHHRAEIRHIGHQLLGFLPAQAFVLSKLIQRISKLRRHTVVAGGQHTGLLDIETQFSRSPSNSRFIAQQGEPYCAAGQQR